MKIPFGIAALALLCLNCFAAEPKYSQTASGLRYAISAPGKGPVARKGQYIVFNYVAKLEDGTVFDDSKKRKEPMALTAGEPGSWIAGLQEGLELLHAGDKATLLIPPAIAYGEKGNEYLKVPANATVRYDVEITGIKTQALSDVMFRAMKAGGLENGKKVFAQLKAKDFPDVYPGSGMLNYLGYGYLYRFNKFPEAIALLQWNLELYPDNGNLVDSLAEAYFVSGDRAKAIEYYEKALKLEPEMKGSQKMLEKLKNNPKSPTDLERLQMCLQGAPGFAEPLSEEPMNIPYLQKQLESYLAKATAAEAADAAKQVELFLGVLEMDKSQGQAAMFRKFSESPLEEVRKVAVLAQEASRQTSQANQTILEQIKKPIEMKFTALDGSEVDLAKLRGKVVLIEFWAAWSPASARALPDVIAAYDKYRSQGFEVIGISMDQNPEGATAQEKEYKRIHTADEVRTFVKDNKMPWPQHYDGKGWNNSFGVQYWVKTVPTFFLLDKSGTIAATDTRGPKLEEEVKRLLAAPMPAPAPAAAAAQ